MRRREYLALTGAAGLAGCIDLPGGSGGTIPHYADWLGEPGYDLVRDAHGFASIDLSAVFGSDDAETPTETADEEGPLDALVQNPAIGGLAATFSLVRAASEFGLARLADFEDPDLPTERATVADAMVLEGSFDADAIAADSQAYGLVPQDEVGGFQVLYDDGSGTDELSALATDGDHVVYHAASRDDPGFRDPLDVVEGAIARYTGDDRRLHEGSEDNQWLLRTAGGANLVVGFVAEGEKMTGQLRQDAGDLDFVAEFYRDAKGVVQGVGTPAGSASGPREATAALVYPDAGLVDADRLRSVAGQRADSRSVQVDGRRVVVEATYESQ